jgi:branched-chain amino acid transport system ATP-binding protein
MVTIIGPNGAGKSTLLNCISGLLGITGGTIKLEGRDIAGEDAYRISRAGLLQVPEGRQILGELSVLENLQLGVTALHGRKPTHDLRRIYALFPILEERGRQRAGSLSGGQQQMLAIGRALMGGPRLLLLDEPSLGLSPLLAKTVLAALGELNREGLTILLVEQNARAALRATNHGFVLEQGRIVHQGPSADLARDPDVISHYLGQASASAKVTA